MRSDELTFDRAFRPRRRAPSVTHEGDERGVRAPAGALGGRAEGELDQERWPRTAGATQRDVYLTVLTYRVAER